MCYHSNTHSPTTTHHCLSSPPHTITPTLLSPHQCQLHWNTQGNVVKKSNPNTPAKHINELTIHISSPEFTFHWVEWPNPHCWECSGNSLWSKYALECAAKGAKEIFLVNSSFIYFFLNWSIFISQVFFIFMKQATSRAWREYMQWKEYAKTLILFVLQYSKRLVK